MISIAYAFSGCTNFNQNIQIPNSIINMIGTFSGCTNFNQNIQIPNNVNSCVNMFMNCTNFDQNLMLPYNSRSFQNTFINCNKLSNICMHPGFNGFPGWMNNFCRNNATQSLNIWLSTNHTSLGLSAILNGYIVQGVKQSLTWDTITNGFYNSQYNIYVYTNGNF